VSHVLFDVSLSSLGTFAECSEAADRQKNQMINSDIESDYEREPREKTKPGASSTGSVACHSVYETSDFIQFAEPKIPSSSLSSFPFKGKERVYSRTLQREMLLSVDFAGQSEKSDAIESPRASTSHLK
jgi:hypothetical protein